eukprot:TRINITY_DN77476_c0_g1_i1.p1 TRINITY_DN77476_c0_g1~~TRINITY_DN77476_c0_g1_i1.p1  ORF type:complete len:614 (+),score=133.21 TRINITY_DN77476_c0_g1_i1:26-1843(+)
MAARVRKLASHLVPASVQSAADSAAEGKLAKRAEEIQKLMNEFRDFTSSMDELMSKGTLPSVTQWDLLQSVNHAVLVSSKRELALMLDGADAEGRLELAKLLPGPWKSASTRGEQVALLQEVQLANAQGNNVQQIAEWQLRYGKRGLSSNIAVPVIANEGAGSKLIRHVDTRVIVADPEDAARLSRIHVKKEGIFESTIVDSVISTTDNEDWRRQRGQLAEVFLPLTSLAQILPASLDRAKRCAERLAALVDCGGAVDMSDFLLHEAQAQLQLALMGLPESVMESTNCKIRSAFQGHPGDNEPRALANALRQIMEAMQEEKNLALPSDQCPVRGPMAQALKVADLSPSSVYGNMLLILFAGHDTTGHTMTWLLFELCRKPEIQEALHAEVDEFFSSLRGRDPEYQDLSRLPLMDRCITETLRLWPAVANGTFRRLQFKDTVKGEEGDVQLPKGTLVNIVNWSRHRNPELWGSAADEFDPYRDFAAEEVARVGCPMAGKSPQSERFSPFAHAPRSCLGRNFAQMEMRLIMLNLLRSFDFSLAAPYDSLQHSKTGVTARPDEFRGLNRATMGPMDLERSGTCIWGKRHLYGLKMNVKLRSSSPVLPA